MDEGVIKEGFGRQSRVCSCWSSHKGARFGREEVVRAITQAVESLGPWGGRVMWNGTKEIKEVGKGGGK